MLNIAHEMVEIPLSGIIVKGLLFGNDTLWSFESSDPEFLAVFPSGAAYSFSDYGNSSVSSVNRHFQDEVWMKMREILKSRHIMAEL